MRIESLVIGGGCGDCAPSPSSSSSEEKEEQPIHVTPVTGTLDPSLIEADFVVINRLEELESSGFLFQIFREEVEELESFVNERPFLQELDEGTLSFKDWQQYRRDMYRVYSYLEIRIETDDESSPVSLPFLEKLGRSEKTGNDCRELGCIGWTPSQQAKDYVEYLKTVDSKFIELHAAVRYVRDLKVAKITLHDIQYLRENDELWCKSKGTSSFNFGSDQEREKLLEGYLAAFDRLRPESESEKKEVVQEIRRALIENAKLFTARSEEERELVLEMEKKYFPEKIGDKE